MLVKMGKADALLGGATYSTADTVRPALQLIKTKPGATLVSSCFIMTREGGDPALQKICMADCAINLSYEDTLDKEGNVKVSAAQKLAEVAVESARTAEFFGIEPKVAMLSFSTKGSGKGGTVALSAEATKIAQELVTFFTAVTSNVPVTYGATSSMIRASASVNVNASTINGSVTFFCNPFSKIL